MFNLPSFLIYIFVTAYTPGPNNIMSMSNASRFGFKRSFPFNLGILAGFAIVMPFCSIFSATLFQYIPKVKIFMLVLGAAYMLYLAWKTYTSSSDLGISESKEGSFLAGMLLQFVNPKIYIYTITSMSAFILPVYDSPWILLGFALILSFVGFTGTVLWSLFGSVFCRLFSEKAKAVNTVMALLLVYCAISLFF